MLQLDPNFLSRGLSFQVKGFERCQELPNVAQGLRAQFNLAMNSDYFNRFFVQKVVEEVDVSFRIKLIASRSP